MTNITHMHPIAAMSVEYVPTGRGIAIVRGDQVQAVLTRDELPALVLAAAKVLQR